MNFLLIIINNDNSILNFCLDFCNKMKIFINEKIKISIKFINKYERKKMK